ncbi:MAG: hypothetical protein HC847_27180 [Hydrococcus sp. RU_2_2]|nr:hypothetical protein [Hydrococcus sp. RU_2_2]
MRKVTFVKRPDNIQKLMLYESTEGVYLFGYDCLQDTSAKWDNWYMDVQTAIEYCSDVYGVGEETWISISDPCEHCQHDFISPTRIKGREIDKPMWGQLESLENGKWKETVEHTRYQSFDGLTGNERLFVSGLMTEFDQAQRRDREKAIQILRALDFDESSIKKIVK